MNRLYRRPVSTTASTANQHQEFQCHATAPQSAKVIVAVMVNVLSFEATRQVDVLHKHVARVHALSIAGIRTSTAAWAQVARVVLAIARIAAPSRIVVMHGAPP